jgi:hypothetical protein
MLGVDKSAFEVQGVSIIEVRRYFSQSAAGDEGMLYGELRAKHALLLRWRNLGNLAVELVPLQLGNTEFKQQIVQLEEFNAWNPDYIWFVARNVKQPQPTREWAAFLEEVEREERGAQAEGG